MTPINPTTDNSKSPVALYSDELRF